jgi:quercetin dioxygenase-like cupin family protein
VVAAEGALRPGQPRQASIIEFEPGACWQPSDDGREQHEWLVLAGQITLEAADIGAIELDALDFHVAPAESPTRMLSSCRGATVYLRAAPQAAGGPDVTTAATVRDAASAWDDFAPGIRRRTLWTNDVEAAYLVRAEAGAQVPAHGHRFDEECLMIDGDLYLGDILLRGGDYQLAPVGTRHGLHQAGSALTLFVRGDVELRFDP